jgi:hypothetical protein
VGEFEELNIYEQKEGDNEKTVRIEEKEKKELVKVSDEFKDVIEIKEEKKGEEQVFTGEKSEKSYLPYKPSPFEPPQNRSDLIINSITFPPLPPPRSSSPLIPASEKPYPEIKLIKEEPELNLITLKNMIQSELKQSFIDINVVHEVPCSGCKRPKVRGVIYKCTTCVCFYLCSECEDKIAHCHSLLKLKKPQKLDQLEVMMGKICDEFKFADRNKVKQAILESRYDINEAVTRLLNS